MGGGNIISYAGNAAVNASKVFALSFTNAQNMRASENLYEKGACFADNAACARRYAGR